MSAAGWRCSTRSALDLPMPITRSEQVRFSTPHVGTIGAHTPGT